MESSLSIIPKVSHVDKSDSVSYLSPLKNVPNEVLSHIFVLSSCDSSIQLPYRRHQVPYQVTISQVCSRWRQAALSTGTLWTNVGVLHICTSNYSHCLFLYQIWVGRAGNLPLTVALVYYYGLDLRKLLLDFVAPFWLRTLDISLSYGDLSALSDLPNLDVEEFTISLTNSNDASLDLQMPHFMDRTRRICFRFLCANMEESESMLNVFCSLWRQLRYLECNTHTVSLTTWLNVLHQAQSLEQCHLTIANAGNGPSVGVYMPSLRSFAIKLLDVHPDIVIPLITIPNITMLGIYSDKNWSFNTYDIIKQHYKLHQLHEIHLFTTKFPTSIVQVLADAPMVRNLRVHCAPVPDAEAREGIASGRLGRCLTSLRLTSCFDHAGEWLDTIESRQRNVKSMITQVSNWRQVFTGIKWVEFWDVEAAETFEGRVATLKALGTIVVM